MPQAGTVLILAGALSGSAMHNTQAPTFALPGWSDFAGMSAQCAWCAAGVAGVAAIASHAVPMRKTSAIASSASSKWRIFATDRGRIRVIMSF